VTKYTQSRNVYLIEGNEANDGCRIEKTAEGGSCGEEEGCRGAQGRTERIMEGRRPVGRSRGRWLVAVIRVGKRVLMCRNWRRSTEDREVWR
jgi:hypothetical protein